jgi:hypothetical protein
MEWHKSCYLYIGYKYVFEETQGQGQMTHPLKLKGMPRGACKE